MKSATAEERVGGTGPAMVDVETAWPTITFTAIGEAWRLYRCYWGTWSLTMLAALVATSLGQGVAWLFTAAVGAGMMGGLFAPGLPLLGSLLGMMIAGFFVGGMVRMAVRQIRGRRPHVRDLFQVTDDWFDVALGSVLFGVPFAVGCSLFVVPGLIVGGLFLFMFPLIVDTHLPATGAMIRSYHAARPQWLAASAVHLAILAAAGSGFLLAGIGLLFTGPLYALSLAVLYRDIFLSPSAVSWNKPRNPFEDF
jgi:uncharacterized membrane protein